MARYPSMARIATCCDMSPRHSKCSYKSYTDDMYSDELDGRQPTYKIQKCLRLKILIQVIHRRYVLRRLGRKVGHLQNTEMSETPNTHTSHTQTICTPTTWMEGSPPTKHRDIHGQYVLKKSWMVPHLENTEYHIVHALQIQCEGLDNSVAFDTKHVNIQYVLQNIVTENI